MEESPLNLQNLYEKDPIVYTVTYPRKDDDPTDIDYVVVNTNLPDDPFKVPLIIIGTPKNLLENPDDQVFYEDENDEENDEPE